MRRYQHTFTIAASVLVLSGVAAFAAGTPEQRRACRGDAMRLCRDFIPNVSKITACMQGKVAQLSPACKAQFN